MTNLSIQTLTIAILFAVLAVTLFLVFCILIRRKSKNEMKFSLSKKVFTVILSFFLLATVVANGVIYQYNNVIGQFMLGDLTKSEEGQAAYENSKAVTEEVEDEGIVLLKNDGNSLPLSTDGGNVNVFGIASQNFIFSGTGSGSNHSVDSSKVSLKQGLENSNFKLNQELVDFYAENATGGVDTSVFDVNHTDFNIYEPSVDSYSEEMLQNAKEFSDTAIVVFARSGGEKHDLPLDMGDYVGGTEGRHYLELQQSEEDMLNMVKSIGFEKIIVLIDSSHAMELGFLEDENIDAALWIGGPGSSGCNSIGEVLAGKVNPSGRLADTYPYDATSAPSYNNFGEFMYTDSEGLDPDNLGAYYYVDYAEGIYVGYRYYETRYIDNMTGKCDETAYNSTVQYPFGYGLSYTTFGKSIENYSADDTTITMTVRVENTGNAAGKEVVQMYYTAPYTVGGIEKSHVVLGDFAKTSLLEPGQSETVELSLPVEDMASYDYQNAKAYVLDEGVYQIKLMDNAHQVIDSREYEVQETKVFDENNKRSTDEIAATNQFDYAIGDNVTYVSRSDWEGTLPTERSEAKQGGKELFEKFADVSVDENNDADPIVVKDNGVKFEDLKGRDYNDPLWDSLLEQISVDEMVNFINLGGFATQEIRSIDKLATIEVDGPAGINGMVNQASGNQFTSEVVLAATWNKELAEKMGTTFAKEATAYGVSGLYAPGLNIHRSPFGGRNFEYYSEDATLSGKMATAVIKGGNREGVYFCMKHFALNDQEQNRYGLATWSNEQAIREIYLRPFEVAVKDGGAKGIMGAYCRIGYKWCSGNKELITNVLKNEWGFKGIVVTDWIGLPMQNPDYALAAGTNLMLNTVDNFALTSAIAGTNSGQQKMREAMHEVLYTVVNSNALEVTAGKALPTWVILLGVIDTVILLMFAFFYRLILKDKKRIKDDKEA